jgi:membrane protease YdiL (CAAX protease family)
MSEDHQPEHLPAVDPAATSEAAPAKPPAIWPVFVVFAMALVIVSLGGVVVILVVLGSMVASKGTAGLLDAGSRASSIRGLIASPAVILSSAGISFVTLTALALLAARRSGQGVKAALRLRSGGLSPLYYLLAVLAMLAISDVSDRVISLTNAAEVSVIGLISGAIISASWPAFVVLALLITSAGVSEEIFFRGYIQTRLATRWRSWSAIVVTAALFGAMHFDLIHTPFALLAGLCLGWLAERSGSILPSMLAHCVNNLISVVGSRLLAGSWYAQAHLVMLPVSVVMALAALLLLHRMHRARAAGLPAGDLP